MTYDIYKYQFDESIPVQELEDTLTLALLAVESLHSRSRMLMECRFNLDKVSRTCVIAASTDVGNDLARIFTGFATKEYGYKVWMIFVRKDTDDVKNFTHTNDEATITINNQTQGENK